MVHFTDEEMYGKFLDLHELHDLLKGVEVGGWGDLGEGVMSLPWLQ